MNCPQCQAELPDDAQFCNKCGGKLELNCPSCGMSNPPESNFCLKCGHNLTSPAKAVSPKDLSFDEKLAKIQKYLAVNLKKAETMFREMGMDYWLAKAQQALARL
jgi:ribosomal protein L40E